MTVFDLSEIQATYILEMPLRRLTKFSRLELETERDELRARIAELTEILDDDKRLRRVVGDELAAVAKDHGTPRRTVLLESSPAHRPARPCRSRSPTTRASCCSSSTGLLARTGDDRDLPADGERGRTTSSSRPCAARARGQVGLVTSTGRVCASRCSTCRRCRRPTARRRSPAASRSRAFVELEQGEQPVGLCSLAADGPGLALGTAAGRRQAGHPRRPDLGGLLVGHPARGRRPGGRRGRARHRRRDARVRHHRRPAAALPRVRRCARRAVRRAAWPASGSSDGQRVRVLRRGRPRPRRASSSRSPAPRARCPARRAPRVKVTPFSEYPGKGRATGGVRAQRFLKGEDTLLVAWVGPGSCARGDAAGRTRAAAADRPEARRLRAPDVEAGRRGRRSRSSRADRARRRAGASRPSRPSEADRRRRRRRALLGAARAPPTSRSRAARRGRAPGSSSSSPVPTASRRSPSRTCPRRCAPRSASLPKDSGTTVLLARRVGRHADDHAAADAAPVLVRARRRPAACGCAPECSTTPSCCAPTSPTCSRPRRTASCRRGARRRRAAAARVHQRQRDVCCALEGRPVAESAGRGPGVLRRACSRSATSAATASRPRRCCCRPATPSAASTPRPPARCSTPRPSATSAPLDHHRGRTSLPQAGSGRGVAVRARRVGRGARRPRRSAARRRPRRSRRPAAGTASTGSPTSRCATATAAPGT